MPSAAAPPACPTSRNRLRCWICSSKQNERFSQPDAKPWDLAASDPANPPALPDGITPAQAAAWTAVGRVLLNLDETITKE